MKKNVLCSFLGQKGVKKGSKRSLIFYSKTALRIFLIFGMKLSLYKGFILAEAFFRKKSQTGEEMVLIVNVVWPARADVLKFVGGAAVGLLFTFAHPCRVNLDLGTSTL